MVSIDLLCDSHLERILEMTKEEFPDSYNRNEPFFRNSFEKLLLGDNVINLGTFQDDNLIGFLMALEFNEVDWIFDSFSKYLSGEHGELVPNIVSWKDNLKESDICINNLIVDKNYRNNGYGNLLLSNCLSKIESPRQVLVYTGSGGMMTNSYLRTGFEQIVSIWEAINGTKFDEEMGIYGLKI